MTDLEQPSIMDALLSTWDTYQLFEQVREHMPVIHVDELDAWVLSRYEDIAPILNDPKAFGCMPADMMGEVPEEIRAALPHGYGLTDSEIVGVIGQLIIAGFETTAGSIPSCGPPRAARAQPLTCSDSVRSASSWLQ